MCRLAAITASDIQPGMRRLFFDQLMMLSMFDEEQIWGAGITDGTVIYKSHHKYIDYGSTWLQHLDTNAVWMGHVRRPSKGTEVSPRASHPFVFDLSGNRKLIAMHNGGIRGMEITDEMPNVDSYAAFSMLAAAMDEEAISAPLISEWVSQFGPGSEYAFMLMEDTDTLYIVRGQRTMHALPFGNGFVFNTSHDVLTQFKKWVNLYWPSYKTGKIKPIGANQLVTAPLGSATYALENVSESPSIPIMRDEYYVYAPDTGERYISLT